MLQNALREYGTVSADPTVTAPEGADTPALFGKGATRAGVDVRRFPWIRPLSGDYAFNFEKVAALYAGNPATPAAWVETIARVQAHPREAAAVAGVLAGQQERRGAPPEAREAASRLADAKTVAVVTGQQAGVLGGPMYTLLKAITAIQLARRVSADHGVPVVPLFWVDAEDHDWDEIASCTVLGPEHEVRTITIPPPDGAGHIPIGALALDDSIGPTLDELAAAFPRTDFTDEVMASLRDAYQPGRGVGEAFARWIESVLGRYGLVVFESGDPTAKPYAAELFARELETAGRTAALAAEGGRRMAALGHAPQVDPQSDSPALFHIDGARTPIGRDDGHFVIGEERVPAADLIAEARRTPAHFSPNVLLRPIVQDTLFPTIAYVAGPSELAYLGQLRDVYAHFGRPMPLIYPRATATLVDAAAARFFRKYPVRFEDLQPQGESALNRLTQSQLPESVDAALRETEEAVRGSLKRVAAVIPQVDPTLAGAAQTTLRKMEGDLRSLQSKVIQAAKRRDDTLRRQYTHVQIQVFPLGHPQERTIGIVSFTNQYGAALADRLIEELPLDMGRHWVVAI
jgi:bacillithiol biosynthesis cysteine-adding enzyme BshC